MSCFPWTKKLLRLQDAIVKILVQCDSPSSRYVSVRLKLYIHKNEDETLYSAILKIFISKWFMGTMTLSQSFR